MIKGIRNKTIKLCALAVTFIISLLLLFFLNNNFDNYMRSSAISFDNDFVLKEEYDCNEEIAFPNIESVKVGDYPAKQAVIIDPSGNVFSAHGVMLFKQQGNYLYKVYYEKDGVTLSSDYEFVVLNDAFTVGMNNSSIEYKELTQSFTPSDNYNINIEKGVRVNLQADDTLTYSKPIKLNSAGETNIISLKEYSWTDCFDMYIRLTDCYNPDIYVDIILFANYDKKADTRHYFLSASFNGGTRIGFQQQWAHYAPPVGSNVDNLPPSEFYKNKENSRWKFFEYPSGSGNWYKTLYLVAQNYSGAGKDFYKNGYSTFSYNAKEQICSWGYNVLGTKYVINDFTLPKLYTTNPFSGFINDEVYLSIRVTKHDDLFDGITTSAFHNVEFEIADIAGNNLNNEFDINRKYKDDVAPELNVEYDLTANNCAYAAQDCLFPLFKADGTDVNLKSVYAEVYYNYKKINQTYVSNDGRYFYPSKPGKYTIVYTAEDYFGNKTQKSIPVICVKNINNEMISFKMDDSCFNNLIVRAGYTTILPDNHEVGITSINGEYEYRIKAVHNGTETILDDSCSFTPFELGDWQIIYEVTDAVCTVEKVYNIYVYSSDCINYDKEPVFPRYFIKNASYSLDSFKFYSFVGGKKEITPSVSVRFDGEGEFSELNNNLINKVSGSDYLEIQYKYDNKLIYESGKLPIIDVGYSDKKSYSIAKYFKGDFVSESFGGGIFFKSDKSSGNDAIEFIKDISASNFNLTFNHSVNRQIFDGAYADETEYPEGYFSNYNELRIKLTDYYDLNNIIEIQLVKTFGGSVFSVNGKTSLDLVEDFQAEQCSIRYDTQSNAFVCGETKIPMSLPFTTDRCYLSLELAGISGNAGITISQINNQIIARANNDKAVPQIDFKYNKNNQKINTSFQLNVPYVTDVLSPVLNSDIKITVTAPSGEKVVSPEGVELNEVVFDKDIIIVFKEYGTYSILILYKDLSGRSGQLNAFINVVPDIPPQIIYLEGNFEGEVIDCKVGESVPLKNVIGYDVIDGSISASICILQPNNILQTITGQSYTVQKPGKYKVLYLITTSDGRFSTTYYTLNVV